MTNRDRERERERDKERGRGGTDRHTHRERERRRNVKKKKEREEGVGERKSIGMRGKKVWEQLKGKVGGDGNMCVGVFYTSVRGWMEVSGGGWGPADSVCS